MAVTSSWYRKCKLTIPVASVPGDQTDFPVQLIWNGTTGNLPAEVYNSGTSSPKSDGSDIRFTSDEAGTTELAFEIVTFEPNATVGSARIKIWIKLPSVSSATPTNFYMWWNNIEATAYAATDTYGRNNVWTNSYLGVWHLNESSGTTATNSVGSNNGTYTGTTFPNRVNTTYGYMQNFVNANANYVSIGTGSPWTITGNISLSAVVTVTSYTAAWQAIIAKGDFTYRLSRNNTSNGITFDRSVSGGFRAAVNTTVITSGYHHVAGTFDSTSGSRAFTDGSSGTLDANTSATLSDSKNLAIGRNADQTGRDWNGYIGEVKIANTVRSTTWMTTEYNTTIGFATFVTVSVPSTAFSTQFPYGWERKCLLTVDYTKCALSFNGFPIPLIWNGSSGNLPAEVYNASIYSPMSDGRDIRFSYDAAGKYQIPFEIVTFTPNSTTANARVEIWVKLNISNTTNLTFYIWYCNPDATALSVTNTYGRNAVWNAGAFLAVYHMDGSGDAVDSTGNNRTLTNSGSTASTTALGTARDFNGTNRDYLYATAFSGNPTVQGFSALVEVDSVDTFAGTVCSDRDCVAMIANASGQPTGFYYQGSSVWNNTSVLTDIRGAGLRHISYAADPGGSMQRMMLNGGSEVDSTNTTAISYSGLGTQFTVGRHGNGGTTYDYDGRIDELWVFNFNHSANWNLTEYNSKVGFSTFITASTPEWVATIKYDNSSSSSSATSPFSFNHTIGNGTNRVLIVGISIEDTGTVAPTSVTYNGVAMSSIGSIANGINKLYLYQLLESSMPVAGTYSISVTLSGNPTSGAIVEAISLWNVDPKGYTTYATNTVNSNSNITLNITPQSYYSWIVSFATNNDSTSYTATAPLVERLDVAAVSQTTTGATMADMSPVAVTLTEVSALTPARQAIIATSYQPYTDALVLARHNRMKSFDRGFDVGLNVGFESTLI